MAKITVIEYVKRSQKELEEFKNKWVEQNLKDSDNWPNELEEAEWGAARVV